MAMVVVVGIAYVGQGVYWFLWIDTPSHVAYASAIEYPCIVRVAISFDVCIISRKYIFLVLSYFVDKFYVLYKAAPKSFPLAR